MKSKFSSAVLLSALAMVGIMMPVKSKTTEDSTYVPRPELLEQVLAEAKAKRKRKAKKA
jgi:hypothetical protein